MPRPSRILIVVPLISLALVFFTRTVFAQAPPAPLLGAGAQADFNVPDPNVVERGPIHEAFAEPIALDIDPADAPIIDRAPPEPIDELPPEIRPEGNNVEWLGGYWMFSVEQDDFIWISGVWREIPPGREWVPGHWSKVPGGFQWVSGFWAAVGQQEVQFLPQPPQTLEQGPVSPAPSDSHFWIPGCWTWNQARYVWRPGYWYAGQNNWLWTPDHYVWTPRGFVYVAGYWDYPLANRGLLFAPVYWNNQYRWNTVRYRPRHVVNTSLLLTSLFVNSPYRHYYYGYGNNYANFGLRPWYDVRLRNTRGSRHLYDPFYAYHRWHDGRRNPNWIDNYRHHFDGPRKGRGGQAGPRDGRGNRGPDQRGLDQIVRNGNDRGPKGRSVLQANTRKLNNLVMPLGQFASNTDAKAKLQRVSQQQQLDAIRGSDRVRDLARLRAQQEVLKNAKNAGKQRAGGNTTSQIVRDTLRLPERYRAGKPITTNGTGTNGTGTNSTRRLRAETQPLGQGRPDVTRNDSQRDLGSSQATQLRRQLELQNRGKSDQVRNQGTLQRNRSGNITQQPSVNQQREAARRVGEQQQQINNFLRNQQQRLREQTRSGSPNQGSTNTMRRSNTTRPLGSGNPQLRQPSNSTLPRANSNQPRIFNGTTSNTTRGVSPRQGRIVPQQSTRNYQPRQNSSPRIITSPSSRSGQSFQQQFRGRSSSQNLSAPRSNLQQLNRGRSSGQSSFRGKSSSSSNRGQIMRSNRGRRGK